MDTLFYQWNENFHVAIQYFAEDKTREAEYLLNLCLMQAHQINIPIIKAFTQRFLGTVMVRNRKLKEAEKLFLSALQLCIELQNHKGIAEALAGLGSIWYLKKQYNDAENYFQRAIEIYPNDASKKRLAVLYSELGQVYKAMESWEKAKSTFEEARGISNNNDDLRGEAEACLHLGEIYFIQRESSLAFEMLKKAGELFFAYGDLFSLAYPNHHLSVFAFEKNKIEEALFYQYRALALYLRQNNVKEISDSYYLLSSVYQTGKYHELGKDSLSLSLKYYEGDELGLALRYHNMAVLHWLENDLEEAKKLYYKALKDFRLHGDGAKIREVSDELTYLNQYIDVTVENTKPYWTSLKNSSLRLGSILLLLSKMEQKGEYVQALKYCWLVLNNAKKNGYDELEELEKYMQNLSKIIRKK